MLFFSTKRSFFCLLVATVAAATLHQAWKEKSNNGDAVDFQKEHLAVRALHCFSLIENGRSLLSTKDNIKGSLSCLHGIRVLSMFWIVLLHISEESLNRYTYNRVRTQEVIPIHHRIFVDCDVIFPFGTRIGCFTVGKTGDRQRFDRS